MNFCIKFDTKTIMSTSQNQTNYDTLPSEIHDHIWKIVHGMNMYDVKKELKATRPMTIQLITRRYKTSIHHNNPGSGYVYRCKWYWVKDNRSFVRLGRVLLDPSARLV